MKTFTINTIRSWTPCYDPNQCLPEGWSGTVLDLLSLEDVPAEYRVWVALREELLDKKTLRLFAVWCGRAALKTIENPDSRLIAACAVAERFAHGKATATELSVAWDDASDAGQEFGGWDAALDAARDAAWDDTRDAAWGASWASAWAVASDSGREVGWDADLDVARDDALAFAWEAQIEQLSKMI